MQIRTKSLWQIFKNLARRYRRLVIYVSIFWAFWFFGLGTLSGWLLSKSGLEKFPEINSNDRLLILAPHIDDEIISSGGLIQEALRVKAEIKIVYLTNGDDNLFSVIKSDKNLKAQPNDFIVLGEERMAEGKKAVQVLGLKETNLIFLGYPDRGLYYLLNQNYNDNNPYVSQGTKLTYNPYSNTYHNQQSYTGSNVFNDLNSITKDFQPTIIIVPHNRDKNTDHLATYLFQQKVFIDQTNKPRVFAYLIHYSLYPPKKKLIINDFLYPPKKLFSAKGWYSFNLTSEQEKQKLEAIKQFVSQKELGQFYDLLSSFVKKNEIFEEIE